jgi:uncharacterized protein DUF955
MQSTAAETQATDRLIVSEARSAARRLAAQAPEHCGGWRVGVKGLADMLDIEVRHRRDLRAPARWHRVRARPTRQPTLWDEPYAPTAEHDLILLRSDLPEAARRFALAHEIGHAVLQRERDVHHCLDARLESSSGLVECYANAFAAELLLPTKHVAVVRARLRKASDPVELLQVASSLGVSPQTLLYRAQEERWMAGLGRIWLDIRVLPNRFTGCERRPRIHRAVLDKSRWFLPSNRSMVGALGDDSWLSGVDPRRSFTGLLEISEHAQDSDRRRWINKKMPVEVSARRLRYTSNVAGIDFLACVQMRHECV